MTKIKCLNCYGPVAHQRYTTAKGNTYEFDQDVYTEVKDAEDALYFLKAGSSFVAKEGPVEGVIKKLMGLIKKEVFEEPEPVESGALEPSAEDLALAESDAPIDGVVEPTKKDDEGPSLKDLELMTKLELDKYAEKKYDIHLDRRKSKNDMISEFFEELRKKVKK